MKIEKYKMDKFIEFHQVKVKLTIRLFENHYNIEGPNSVDDIVKILYKWLIKQELAINLQII